MENSFIVTGTSPNYTSHLNQSYVSYVKSPEGIMYHDPVTTWRPLPLLMLSASAIALMESIGELCADWYVPCCLNP